MSKYDPTFDNKLVLRPCDLISWLSDFVLYLNTLSVNVQTSFRLCMNECYQTLEQKVRKGHYNLSSCFSYSDFYFIHYSENQCISKLDKIGIFIDMKFH